MPGHGNFPRLALPPMGNGTVTVSGWLATATTVRQSDGIPASVGGAILILCSR
jgi:hypothetical protein